MMGMLKIVAQVKKSFSGQASETREGTSCLWYLLCLVSSRGNQNDVLLVQPRIWTTVFLHCTGRANPTLGTK